MSTSVSDNLLFSYVSIIPLSSQYNYGIPKRLYGFNKDIYSLKLTASSQISQDNGYP